MTGKFLGSYPLVGCDGRFYTKFKRKEELRKMLSRPTQTGRWCVSSTIVANAREPVLRRSEH